MALGIPSLVDPARITPYLYLGSVKAAQSQEILGSLGIKRVLNLTRRYPNFFEGELTYKHLALLDEMDTDLKSYFEETSAFIEEACTGDEPVLVHCEAGISRSSTVVIAYLMKKAEMTLKTAYELVLSRKSNIGPNKHFFQQLIDYERELYEDKVPGFESSITLVDYLADQIIRGPLFGMGIDLATVKSALTETNCDQNAVILSFFA